MVYLKPSYWEKGGRLFATVFVIPCYYSGLGLRYVYEGGMGDTTAFYSSYLRQALTDICNTPIHHHL